MPTNRPEIPRVSSETPDLVAERVARLRELVPEAFAEGKLDADKLRALLGDAVDTRPEKYSFTWAGKRDAIRLLATPSHATLIPARDESVDFDTTKNLFIEGDNLEVLKVLYKSYFGRVKLIYIDPPYNTGKDFIYPDDYKEPLDTYLKLTGQKDSNGTILTSNPETSGRYHSAWLSMMYPRLFLARQLLCNEGAVFISVDDGEIHNLLFVLNEIFGEENHYATIAWQKKDTPSNDAIGISVTHEYVVVYARSEKFIRNLLARTEDQLANYKNPDNDPRGVWTRGSLTRKEFVERDYYGVTNPAGRKAFPPPGTSWRVSPETFAELERDNRLWWGKDKDGDMPFAKRFLTEVQAGVVPITWWDYEFAGSNRNAKGEIRKIFDNRVPFETPKPTFLIRQILRIGAGPDDLILDFFAGSGTTGHAVMALNEEDGGKRRFICVQLPEPTQEGTEARKMGFQTIAQIGEERLRRVGKQICGSTPLIPRQRACGFRILKLVPSRIRKWPNVPHSELNGDKWVEQMKLMIDPLLPGWTPEEVIYEVALKEGFSLTCRVEPADVGGLRIWKVTDEERGQAFRICLSETLPTEKIRALSLGKDEKFFCRAAALDDTAAANLALSCNLKTI